MMWDERDAGSNFMSFLEWFSFDTKTSEPNANRVSGVLIGSANTQRVLCNWTNEQFDYSSPEYCTYI